MLELLAVTGEGLVRLTQEESNWHAELVRADERMRCVAVDPADAATVYVGSRANGVCKSSDRGAHWQGLQLPQQDVFSLAISPADGSVYAGTEPSMLFKSTDGGTTWRELDALRRLPSAQTWSFPPRPETSHVSSIAPNPEDAGLLIVGIELGGLMLSQDGGESWQDHRPGAEKDVHALAWHPRATERAYEAGGGGAAWSRDGGRGWASANQGRDRHYTWALAIDPEDPDCWYISACPGPREAHSNADAQAYVYRWRNNGPWEALAGGLPQPLSSMAYTLLAAERRLFAGLRNGQLYESDDAGDTWRELSPRGASLSGLIAIQAAVQHKHNH